MICLLRLLEIPCYLNTMKRNNFKSCKEFTQIILLLVSLMILLNGCESAVINDSPSNTSPVIAESANSAKPTNAVSSSSSTTNTSQPLSTNNKLDSSVTQAVAVAPNVKTNGPVNVQLAGVPRASQSISTQTTAIKLPVLPNLVPHDIVDTNENDFTNDPSLPATFALGWQEAMLVSNFDLELGTNHNSYLFTNSVVSTNTIERTNGIVRTWQTLSFTVSNTYSFWYMRLRANDGQGNVSKWSNEARFPDYAPNAFALRWSPNTNADVLTSTDLHNWTLQTNTFPPYTNLMAQFGLFRTRASVTVTNRIKTFYLSPPDDLVQ